MQGEISFATEQSHTHTHHTAISGFTLRMVGAVEKEA